MVGCVGQLHGTGVGQFHGTGVEEIGSGCKTIDQQIVAHHLGAKGDIRGCRTDLVWA